MVSVAFLCSRLTIYGGIAGGSPVRVVWLHAPAADARLDRRAPSVDREHGPGDVAGSRRGEERDGVGDLLRFGGAAERGGLGEPVDQRVVGAFGVYGSPARRAGLRR
jgi:hypothetical protein